jgi:hypothetical protein
MFFLNKYYLLSIIYILVRINFHGAVNAQDANADIDFTPEKEDLKCLTDNDCTIIEKGCCYHEKPLAIRKDKSFDVLTGPKGIRAKCREFNADQLKKKEKPISCKGRESSANWTSGLVALCKKAEDKKDDAQAEGECSLAQQATKEQSVEIWVKDPRAKISKLLKYKYGDTWGALRAEAAKLFGKEGLLIYSPGKTYLDSHIIKEEEMKSKSFIMFLPD